MLKKGKALVLGLLAAAMISGCGSTEVVHQPNVNVSIGQQFIDLKKARDAGALSEKEFLRQKEQLIDNVR